MSEKLMLTRAEHQAGAWRPALEAAGFAVVEVPCLVIEPQAFKLPDAAAIDWLVLTSPNGVRALAAGRPSAWPKVAVVGPATALAAQDAGLPVELVAERADGSGLARALAARGLAGTRVLLARGDLAAPDLPAALRAAGAAVEEVVAYRTVACPGLSERLAAALAGGRPDWVVLASGSAFRFLHAAWPELGKARLATIGPRTSAEVRLAGLAVAAEAGEPTVEALIAAIRRA